MFYHFLPLCVIITLRKNSPSNLDLIYELLRAASPKKCVKSVCIGESLSGCIGSGCFCCAGERRCCMLRWNNLTLDFFSIYLLYKKGGVLHLRRGPWIWLYSHVNYQSEVRSILEEASYTTERNLRPFCLWVSNDPRRFPLAPILGFYFQTDRRTDRHAPTWA